jgi:hypothetical protein
MKSNVALKSNVYVRQGVELFRDRPFLKQIRGRGALVKVLSRFSPAVDHLASARRVFTPRQIAEVAWEQRCDICGAIPEGPVTRGGVEQIEFRCPRGQCKTQTYRNKVVLLDLKLVAAATAKMKMTPAELVRRALETFRPCPGTLGSRIGRSTTRRFPVRLTPYEFYFLTDEEIESSLFSFINGEPCQK